MHKSGLMHCWHGLEHAMQVELNANAMAGQPIKQSNVEVKPTGINVPALQTVQLFGCWEHSVQLLWQAEQT